MIKENGVSEINRKDGISYMRRNKKITFDKRITMRFSSEQIENIKSIADYKNISYQKLIRDIIEEYIQKENEY